MALGTFTNADLECLTLENTDSVALNTRTIVGFHKATGKAGGMVALSNGAVGEVAGVIEEEGKDTTGFTSVKNIPVGQRSRVRRRGITIARTAAVAILPGQKVYVIAASGLLTNVVGTNIYVGVSITETYGAADELLTFDMRLA